MSVAVATGSARVLLCDDSAQLREITRFVLERDGDLRVVAEAGDGQTALELAASERPDAIVLDLSMPGPEPAALLDGVRRSAPGAGIVLFSGMGPDLLRSLVEGREGLRHVTKSAPLGQLLASVRAAAAA